MLKLVVWDGSEWSYPALSHELYMSASEVHAGVKRAVAARLMDMHRKIPVKSNYSRNTNRLCCSAFKRDYHATR
jgi:hypothetical protein